MIPIKDKYKSIKVISCSKPIKTFQWNKLLNIISF